MNRAQIWDPAYLSVQALCNGDYERAIRIEVWDWDKNGKHDSMGWTDTTVGSILQKQNMRTCAEIEI